METPSAHFATNDIVSYEQSSKKQKRFGQGGHMPDSSGNISNINVASPVVSSTPELVVWIGEVSFSCNRDVLKQNSQYFAALLGIIHELCCMLVHTYVLLRRPVSRQRSIIVTVGWNCSCNTTNLLTSVALYACALLVPLIDRRCMCNLSNGFVFWC